MEEKYIMLNLEDERTKKVAEVVSNPSCKKILNLLADKEASESEIARELKIPVNTAEYNIKKLMESGLVESVSHFWSVKGKKIKSYRLSRKYIVIAPRKSNWDKFKPVFPAFIVTVVISFIIWSFTQFSVYSSNIRDNVQEKVMSAAPSLAGSVQSGMQTTASVPNYYTWYLLGALSAILVMLLWLWKKQ
jgi:DNA-binding transcriptional ArsR family regulator